MGVLSGVSSFFIFAAFVLFLIASISAPVVHIRKWGFMEVNNNGARYLFGAWGMCQTRTGNDICTKTTLGYDLNAIVSQVANGAQVATRAGIPNGLTKALVLHPIACGISFFAFIIAAASDKCGYFFAAFFSLAAFLVGVVAMAIDFALFAKVKSAVEGNSGITATYGIATWCTLAAVVCLLIGAAMSLFTCCCGRRDRKAARMNRY